MEVPVGEALIGRVVNPLGQPLDGLGEIKTDKHVPWKQQLPVLCNVNLLLNHANWLKSH